MSLAVPQPFARARSGRPGTAGRGTVVVTGASSGIGEASALHLARLGFHVLAGVRTTADFERLRRAPEGLEPVMLDITNPEQIATLVALIEETVPEGLAGLVNNAGIAAVGPIEMIDLAEWREVFEVNVLGTVAMTTALLPALLEARGRVVNISSGAGLVAFPMFGPYAASKFAMEGFNDALRREIAAHGVEVVCVEPGVVASSIFDKHLAGTRDLLHSLSPAQFERYGGLIRSALRSAEASSTGGTSPASVAPAVARALTDRRPKTRYAVGWESRTVAITSRVLPDRVSDFVIRRLTAA
ncbi:MAG: SDR family oxidoreductase [Patulibacter minatonensis]